MRITALLFLLVLGGFCGQAQTKNRPAVKNFVVYLRGANEVPPNESTVVESGYFTLNGNVLTGFFSVVNSSLFPTTAGIYGPARPGENGELIFKYDVAPVQIYPDIGVWFYERFELTPEQVAQLSAGRWYLNVMTIDRLDGEVRGQLCPDVPNGDCDGDGVQNRCDLCPNTPPGEAVDENGCSLSDWVPCNGSWKNHHEYVEAIQQEVFRFWKQGWLTLTQRKAIMKWAKESGCGDSLPQ
jgi:hypothetical protein